MWQTMGYYADLIKEKKEKQNSQYYTIEAFGNDYHVSTLAECDRVLAEVRRVFEIAKRQAHDRLTELQDEFTKFGRELSKIERQIDASNKNSKEEKDNASVQDRFRYKGCMITILKKGENQYTFSVEQNGHEEGTNATYPTQDKAESEAKREIEVNWNEKEEKNNGRIEEMYREIQELKKKGLSSLDIDKYYAAINYRKTAEQYLAEFKKTKNTDYKYAAEGQLRKAEQLEREYKKHLHNSDEKGYYAKLAEEKASKKNARDYDEINKVYKEAKFIVDELRRKYREISSRERDDGNFLYSIIEEKGMPTDKGDQQKAKHASGLLESARRMSTTPRDW